jgi:hypothetical protein
VWSGRSRIRTVLVASGEQQREDVVAVLRSLPALVDQLVQQLVGPVTHLREADPRAAAEVAALQLGDGRGRLGAEVENRREQLAELVQAPAGIEAEDSAQDDLERQALKPRMKRRRLIARPAGDLALGDVPHQAGQALHLLSVKGREHQLALLEVLALVEEDQRPATDHGLEDASALARVQNVRRRGEQLLQLVRLREDHEGRARQQPDREPLAIAGSRALHERDRPRPPPDGLHRCGLPRARW